VDNFRHQEALKALILYAMLLLPTQHSRYHILRLQYQAIEGIVYI